MTGNSTGSSMDYFNIGVSIDFIEHSWNHAQLIYSSTLQNVTLEGKPMNYTHINILEILRFRTPDFAVHYRFLDRINVFRDQSDDSTDLGYLSFSVYNQSILLTLENQLLYEVKS